MKKTILIISIVFFISCSLSSHISGTIVDELGKPIENVTIQEVPRKTRITRIGKQIKTDKNGFFKMKRIDFPDLIISKEGYIPVSTRTLWFSGIQGTLYSCLVEKDSCSHILQKNNIKEIDIEFTTDSTYYNKHKTGTIKNSKVNQPLKGLWLKNYPEELNGLQFRDDDYLYLFGVKPYRYAQYIIINDTISLFQGHSSEKGVIQKFNKKELVIKWLTKNKIATYKKTEI